MATIKPFKASRAKAHLVDKVVSDSFQNYSREDIITTLKTNPYSFLNILCPKNVDYSNADPTEKFNKIHETFKSFKANNTLIEDHLDTFYLYQIKTSKNEIITGFIAAASTEDYRNGVIKKHENTIHSREVLFKDYLKTVQFNAEPVLMTYKSEPNLDFIINTYSLLNPEYQFVDDKQSEHKLWLINSSKDLEIISNTFKGINELYIADGHHRTASSSLLALEGNSEIQQAFMVYLIPESKLKIKSFNRFIKDLNNLNPKQILSEIEKRYNIKKINKEQANEQIGDLDFIMFLEGSYYYLELKSEFKPKDLLSNLNTQLLYDSILNPILEIKDLRNNKRIEYIEEKEDPNEFERIIVKNNFKIAFKMAAISIESLKQIADLNQVMPPKSTYIEPKLKSGLIIYNL